MRIRVQHGLKAASTWNPTMPVSAAKSTAIADAKTIAATTLPESPADIVSTGHLQLFNQYTKQRDILVEWMYGMSYGPAEEGALLNSPGAVLTPMWTAQAVVRSKAIGQGLGRTKKLASEVAARQALQTLGVKV